MNIRKQWWQHVEAWHESGLSQADYCRQQGLNPKTFSTWTRRELSFDKNAPLEIIPVHVASSVPAATANATMIFRLAQGAQFELSTAVSPRWLAELLRCLA